MVTVTDIFGPQPPGIDLNDNQTPQINATVIALYIVAVIAVILRFVTRIKVQRISLGLDDWLIAASLVSRLPFLKISIMIKRISTQKYSIGTVDYTSSCNYTG